MVQLKPAIVASKAAAIPGAIAFTLTSPATATPPNVLMVKRFDSPQLHQPENCTPPSCCRRVPRAPAGLWSR